jgi:hypothetical protein
MGLHACGGIARFFLGRVAEAVVRQAHCPVLTMAHPAEEVLPLRMGPEESGSRLEGMTACFTYRSKRWHSGSGESRVVLATDP